MSKKQKNDQQQEKSGQENPQSGQGTFSLVGQYAKDLSLECGQPFYLAHDTNLKVGVDVGVGVKRLEDDMHEVILKLRGEAKDDNDKTYYLAEVEYAGAFLLKGIPEEHMLGLLSVDGAHLLFPFVRHEFTRLVESAGYRAPPVDPINFRMVFENSQKQMQQTAGEA